jgi:hypothetical protein
MVRTQKQSKRARRLTFWSTQRKGPFRTRNEVGKAKDTHSQESDGGRVSHDTESEQASELARRAHSLESTARQFRTTTERDIAKDTNILDNTEGPVRTQNKVNERGAFTLWSGEGAGQDV